ncbi:MAG: helix-turn-helix domain-containing protein [Nitrospira sp.]|nr:helix-turn-helix domain-containing protein [Nitrospira sp.]
MTSQWAGIGDRLSLLRAAFDESQRQVAEEIGIVHTTISRLEREDSTVDLTQFLALAQHFHVELKWLATGKGPIFKASDELIYLGSASEAGPCRSALELVTGGTPGRCLLIEDHVTEVYRFAWMIETHGAFVCILPGEVKPGPISRALVDFALKNWDIRGSIDINKMGEDALTLLERKALPFSTLHKWLTLAPHRTDLSDIWQLSTPPALAETVRPIFEQLKAQGEMSKEQKREKHASIAAELRALADRAEKSEEVAERLSRLLTQFKSESAAEKAKQKKQGA